nr:hypothetical protein [Tanacetum cinerariifolium]
AVVRLSGSVRGGYFPFCEPGSNFASMSQRTYLSSEIYEMMIAKGYMPNETTYTIIVEKIAHEDEKELPAIKSVLLIATRIKTSANAITAWCRRGVKELSENGTDRAKRKAGSVLKLLQRSESVETTLVL